MTFFNKVYHYKRKNSSYMLGWNELGVISLLLSIGTGSFLIPGVLLGLLLQTSTVWMFIISFIFLFASVLGSGYCLVIDNQYVRLYYFYFGIPFRRLKIERNIVEIESSHLSKHDRTVPKFYIYEDCSDDSDWWIGRKPTWIALKYKEKEYEIGNSNNSKKILALVKEALQHN